MPKYLNLRLINSTNLSIPMIFSQSLSRPLLNRPSDWSMSVIRFVLPNRMPILTFVDNYYFISMETQGVSTGKIAVSYINQNGNIDSRVIYQIQGFVQMVNQTISQAFLILKGLVPTIPSQAQAPYIIYDEITKLFSIYAQQQYYDETVTNPIYLTFDSIMNRFFLGFPVYATRVPNVPSYRLRFMQYNNRTNIVTYNSVDYIKMTQQASSFSQITDFHSILLMSNLPIQNEIATVNTSDSSDAIVPIISDYCPEVLDISDFNSDMVYNAIFPYRRVQLTSDSPFYSVNISAYISNDLGKLSPLILPAGQSANIKIMFIHKDEKI